MGGKLTNNAFRARCGILTEIESRQNKISFPNGLKIL